jgi:polyisoprenyl-phosphate glycosyltransferase
MRLSVVIPAFNEETNIGAIIEELTRNIQNCSEVDSFEILVVDDHSDDNTFEVVKELGVKNVNVIRLSRRSGSHKAIRAGLDHVQYDTVLCISADGQDDPDTLPRMLDKIKEGYHIVWALRGNRDESFFNKLFAEVFYKLLKLFVPTSKQIDLSRADFYLLSPKVVKSIRQCRENNTSLFGLLIWIGFKQCGIEYKRRARISGQSKWTFKSKMNLAKDWVIAFSGLPLKFISVIGFITALIGLLYAILIFILAVLGKTTPGWAGITIIILIIGGIQMISLGIIGEYLWKNIDETRKRPVYFIEESTLDAKE